MVKKFVPLPSGMTEIARVSRKYEPIFSCDKTPEFVMIDGRPGWMTDDKKLAAVSFYVKGQKITVSTAQTVKTVEVDPGGAKFVDSKRQCLFGDVLVTYVVE